MEKLALVLLVFGVLTCDKNCVPYAGVCACDAPSESAVQTYVPSDEKPPNHGGKREDVNPVTPPSLKERDIGDDERSKVYYEKLSK